MSGRFITFEGGEGTGKSTQVEALKSWLEEFGEAVLVTREPGGTAGAEAVRHVVLSGAAKKLGTEAEALLFAAARADNVANVIAPALKRGETVLCDRYMDSSRVYQGIGGNVPDDVLLPMERAATEHARPDLTLVFDLDPAEGLARAANVWAGAGPDRYEQDDLDAHEKRRQGFLAIARAEPARCHIIDASGSPESVTRQVRDVVSRRFDLGASS